MSESDRVFLQIVSQNRREQAECGDSMSAERSVESRWPREV